MPGGGVTPVGGNVPPGMTMGGQPGGVPGGVHPGSAVHTGMTPGVQAGTPGASPATGGTPSGGAATGTPTSAAQAEPGWLQNQWDTMVQDVSDMGFDDYKKLLGNMFEGGGGDDSAVGAVAPTMGAPNPMGQVQAGGSDMLAGLNRPMMPGSGGLF